MARLARTEYEGAIHHVTVRGNNRRNLFVDDRDRRRFLERLSDGAEKCDVRIYAFWGLRRLVEAIHQELDEERAATNY